ncbi:MAG: histidine phosphatase family protein [Bacillota bacterium]
MAKIYLTRHGETEWNLENRMQGWKESQLTKSGERQAKWLSDRLADINFEAIYSSPLGRALETAKIICSDRKTEIKINENLKEMSFGNWEGKTSSEIKSNYLDEYNRFWEEPHLFKGKSGETFKEVKNRVLPLIKEIISNYKNDILIVTHTVIIKILMAYFEERELSNLWDPPFIHQTCLNLIEVTEDNTKIILHGDTSHYKE